MGVTNTMTTKESHKSYKLIAEWPQSPKLPPKDEPNTGIPGPLLQKAMEYEAWNTNYHQPYYGCNILGVGFKSNEHKIPSWYGEIGDSCQWTGTYLASQAWKYYLTNSPDALQSAIKSIKALINLQKITGTKGFMARYYGPQNSIPHEQLINDPHTHIVNQGEFTGDFWLGHTSKDMYTGWMMGLAIAYDLIPDTNSQNLIRNTYSQVVEALIDQNWVVLNVQGKVTSWSAASFPPNQFKLAWTLSAFHMTGNPKFKAELESRLGWWRRPWMIFQSMAFYHKYMSGYYPNNLEHCAYLTLLRLADVYLSPGVYGDLRYIFTRYVHRSIMLSHNPWLNGIYMAIGGYEIRENNDPHVAQLVQDLGEFRSVPNTMYLLQARDPSTYVLAAPIRYIQWIIHIFEWLMKNVSWLWWLDRIIPTSVAEDAFRISEQCASCFFFNHNPFVVDKCGSDNDRYVFGGTDYLTAYWYARFNHFISPEQ